MASKHNVLVLGMAFVTEENANLYYKNAAKGTSNPYSRDYIRLTALQTLLGEEYSIYSLNDMTKEDECEKQKHIQAKLNRRGAKQVISQTNAEKWRFIFLDYFRFPTNYMRSAYSACFTEFLPYLHEKGVIDEKTEIFVPNLDDEFIEPLLSCKTTELYYIQAKNNLLYKATDNVAKHKFLGDYSNESQVQQLNAKFPFVKVGLLSQPKF